MSYNSDNSKYRNKQMNNSAGVISASDRVLASTSINVAQSLMSSSMSNQGSVLSSASNHALSSTSNQGSVANLSPSTNTTSSTTIKQNNHDRTMSTQYFMSLHFDFESARRELYRLGIKTSYNSEVMIFSTTHMARNQMNLAYLQECNGLILEQKTWRPLVVPPRSLRFNIDTDASNRFLHQGLYHIYKAEDGTCFNMYYYGGKWVISTAKGYDMNNAVWENTTYQSAVVDCLSSIGLSWDTFTNQLDKKHCYSFGFKHPSFHKFWESSKTPLYKIWFIQSVDLNISNDTYLWSSDKSPIAIMKTQEVLRNPIGNLRELYKSAKDSINAFLTTGSVCYGYILRSVNFASTGQHSDLFIESDLMRAIRKTWYENSVIELCHKNKLCKEHVITLSSFLDNNGLELFQLLFPQYYKRMQFFSDTVNMLTDNMISIVREKSQCVTSTRLDDKKVSDNVTDEKKVSNNLADNSVTNNRLDDKKAVDKVMYNKVAEILLQTFKNCCHFNVDDTNDVFLKKAFYGFCCHPSNLDSMYELIYDQNHWPFNGDSEFEEKNNSVNTGYELKTDDVDTHVTDTLVTATTSNEITANTADLNDTSNVVDVITDDTVSITADLDNTTNNDTVSSITADLGNLSMTTGKM